MAPAWSVVLRSQFTKGTPLPLWLHGSEGDVQSSVQIHTNMNVTIMKRVVPCAISRSNGAGMERHATALHNFKEPALPLVPALSAMFRHQSLGQWSDSHIHTNMNVTIMKRRGVPYAMSRSNGAGMERLEIALHEEPASPVVPALSAMFRHQSLVQWSDSQIHTNTRVPIKRRSIVPYAISRSNGASMERLAIAKHKENPASPLFARLRGRCSELGSDSHEHESVTIMKRRVVPCEMSRSNGASMERLAIALHKRKPASPLVARLGGQRSELGSDSHEHARDHHEPHSSVRDQQIQNGAGMERHATALHKEPALPLVPALSAMFRHQSLGEWSDSHIHTNMNVIIMKRRGVPYAMSRSNGAGMERFAIALHKEPVSPLVPALSAMFRHQSLVQWSDSQIHTNTRVPISSSVRDQQIQWRQHGASCDRNAQKEPRFPSGCTARRATFRARFRFTRT
jgi:uncharacterized protein GlcG (DUF336 family)